MNFIKIILLLLSFLLITSCGYSETEDDKYPDMAEFPAVDGDGIELEKYHINFDEVYLFEKDLLGISFNEKEIYAVTMDQGFNKRDSVQITEYYYVSPNGFIYYKKENDVMVKVHYKTKKSIDLDLHPFFKEDFYESKLAELAPGYDFKTFDKSTQKFEDSIARVAAQLNYDQIESKVLPNLLAYKVIDNDYYMTGSYSHPGGTILIYSDVEYYMPKKIQAYTWNTKFGNRIDWLSHFEEVSNLPDVEKLSTYQYRTDDFLTVFDQAIIENKSSGNHYAFGFSPVTYDYLNLDVDGEKATFKAFDTEFDLFKSPDSTAIIIHSDQKGWYRVRSF
ncbi:MAG: hypothetical protein ACSHWW_10760 [Nonlabens sp.]|uniref:hypothetical protein n=1 Tax=Nonlabens sp. TaxID=1888209 RepID=UPI003EF14FE6